VFFKCAMINPPSRNCTLIHAARVAVPCGVDPSTGAPTCDAPVVGGNPASCSANKTCYCEGGDSYLYSGELAPTACYSTPCSALRNYLSCSISDCPLLCKRRVAPLSDKFRVCFSKGSAAKVCTEEVNKVCITNGPGDYTCVGCACKSQNVQVLRLPSVNLQLTTHLCYTPCSLVSPRVHRRAQ
jgi:hypothetical protein